MSKIRVVVLGLGYVGFEICRIFAPNVIVVDNQLYPDRIAWAKENGIKFYHRDIFNTKDIIEDADIVINTVSVTTVPQRAKDSNPIIDGLIKKIGTDGHRYVLDNIRDDALIVFLSTHCVFEGYKNKFNIDEHTTPNPVLAYAQSKHDSEKDTILKQDKYLILRLGSSYGINMALRLKIVANILSIQAAVNRKITITNKQTYKPVVGTRDIAWAIKYLIDNNNLGIYHLVSENVKVGKIAEICKQYVPELEMEDGGGDVENEGYTLSSSKLLKTGFQFSQSIDTEIGNMIKAWMV